MRCNLCRGSGFQIWMDGIEEKCPVCKGKGYIDERRSWFEKLFDLSADAKCIKDAATRIHNDLNALKDARDDIEFVLNEVHKREQDRISKMMHISNFPTMSWSKDCRGVYTQASDSIAQHLFGKPDGRFLIGKTDMDIGAIVVPENPTWTFGMFCVLTDIITIQTGEGWCFYESGVIKGDKFVRVIATKAPLRNKNGEIVGSCGVARYVTEDYDFLASLNDDRAKERMKIYDDNGCFRLNQHYCFDTEHPVKYYKVTDWAGAKNYEEIAGYLSDDGVYKKPSEDYFEIDDGWRKSDASRDKT